MEIKTIKNILDFLEKEENKTPSYTSLRKLNLMYDLENYPDDTQFTHNDKLNVFEQDEKVKEEFSSFFKTLWF
jgi:hypothetical protein